MRRGLLRQRIGWTGIVTARHWRHPVETLRCPLCRLALRGWCDDHPPVLVEERTVRNTITTVGLNHLRDAFEEQSFDTGIRYMAWGSDNTAPAAGNTTLGTEDGRKAVTSFSDTGTGAKKTTTYLAPGEANQTLEELGWFASSTATASADSGIMLARVLYPGGAHTKDSGESIQVDRTDTIS